MKLLKVGSFLNIDETWCRIRVKIKGDGTKLGHYYLDESNFRLIDGIVPAILERDKPHQTFDMPNVHQFNNNPQTVINRFYWI